MNHPILRRWSLAFLLLPGFVSAGCLTESELDEPGATDAVSETGADDANSEAEPVEEAAEPGDDAGTEDSDETDDQSASTRPGMGQGMQAHRGMMQETMHKAMLTEAIDQGLIDEADAELFMRVHEAIDAYRPEGSGMGMNLDAEAKKAMQRGFVQQALADEAISEADAERFTEIHDILLDEGIMQAFESENE